MTHGLHFLRGPTLLLLLLTAPVGLGASLGWMQGQAAQFFTDEDWKLLARTLDDALDDAADDEAREWSNDKSRASGRITPLASNTRGDVTCRRVRIENSAAGIRNSYRYLFCRRGDSDWALGLPRD